MCSLHAVTESDGSASESGCLGHGHEIVLGFERARLNQKPVSYTRFERIGSGSRNGWSHAWNSRAVNKILNRDRIGIGNQMPDRLRILIGFDAAERNDFNRIEFEFAVESENDGIDDAVVWSLAAE